MSNHIFEELPARKHPQASASAAPQKEEGGKGKKSVGGTEESSEKRVRQAVYDIRYRARREDIDLKQAFSQYMSNTSMSAQEQTAVKAKLFGKEGGMKEQYSMESIEWATDNVASALYKVFVEGNNIQEEPELVYERQITRMRDGKEVVLYSVRVTDPKSGKSYVRDADREKITALRAKGLKVEMSDQKPGEAQRDMRRSGKPNDGNLANNYPPYDKVTRGDVIAGRTGRDQMGGKRKVEEGTTLTGGQNTKKITGNDVDNSRLIKVFPQDGSDQQAPKSTIQAGTELPGEVIAETGYSKFLSMLQEKAESQQQQKLFGLALSVKRGQTPRSEVSAEVLKIVDSMSEKKIRDYAKTKHEGLPQKVDEAMVGVCPKCGKCPCECDDKDKRDTRSDKTYRDVVKNKLRSMGMKDPLVMADPEKLEKDFAKIASADSAKVVDEGLLGFFNPKKQEAVRQGTLHKDTNEKKGTIFHNISQRNAALKALQNSFEPGGEVVSEEESDRARDTHQQRGGMAARKDHDRPPAKKLSNAELGIKPGKTWVQKEMERRANERAGNNHPGPDSNPRKTPQAAKGSSGSDVSRNLQSRYGGSSIARSTTTKKED